MTNRIMTMMGVIALAGVSNMAQVPDSRTARGVSPGGVTAVPGGQVGQVTLLRPVRANGVAMAPGTYSVHLTDQFSDEDRWVEFRSFSGVAGRELATVISAGAIGRVAKRRPPQLGETRVETLRGADYVRVWINTGGTHYLVHLPVG